MALIVGLGNPGHEYRGTRHNVGFELIDKLSEKLTISLEPGNGLFFLGKGQYKAQKVTLLKPMNYMNNSGKAVSKVVGLRDYSPAECLICYDDIHLEIGRIKFKPSGSAGGHNGMNDIIERLETNEFARLRIGIGNDFDRSKQSEYVLSLFTPSQRKLIDESLENASDAVLTFLRAGIEKAMNAYN